MIVSGVVAKLGEVVLVVAGDLFDGGELFFLLLFFFFFGGEHGDIAVDVAGFDGDGGRGTRRLSEERVLAEAAAVGAGALEPFLDAFTAEDMTTGGPDRVAGVAVGVGELLSANSAVESLAIAVQRDLVWTDRIQFPEESFSGQ